jgi:hypothetical protein
VIIKARAGTGGPALARYLMKRGEDHPELIDLRHLQAESVKAAMYEMDALARGSRCEKHALHVQMRAAQGERLSAGHWREAVDRYAAAFGLEENQTIVVLHHHDDGSTHCHAVFNRVHPETLRAADLWQNHPRHKELARQMEKDWGLQRVTNEKRRPERDYSEAGRAEIEKGKRRGVDADHVHDRREAIRQAWERSDDAASFAAALDAAGLRLEPGQRRDFIALDEAGNSYAIGKRTTGAPAPEVRARLEGFDPAQWRAQQEQAPEERDGKSGDGREQDGAPGLKPDGSSTKRPNRGPVSEAFRQADGTPRQRWERGAARQYHRLEDRHERERARLQRAQDKQARLERGEATEGFNDRERAEQMAALLRLQEIEKIALLRVHSERREYWYQRELREQARAQSDAAQAARAKLPTSFRRSLREHFAAVRDAELVRHGLKAPPTPEVKPPEKAATDPQAQRKERQAELRRQRQAREQAQQNEQDPGRQRKPPGPSETS